MANGKFVAYHRVSTDKQGRSGLGLDAQRNAVEDYIDGGRGELVAEYVEVESGKRDDRPELERALHRCKVTGSTLLIAKLDRLSRNVAFISNLMDSGVDFVAVDFPQANRLTVHILAAVAEHEREMISQRTKAALAAAKARGVRLGNPNGAAHLRGRGNTEAVEALRAGADAFAGDMAPVLEDVRAEGHASYRAMARELNRRGILTVRGGRWHPATVRNLIRRLRAGRFTWHEGDVTVSHPEQA
jgi:DNA invertase Pin-like site-specific DNA recombinase